MDTVNIFLDESGDLGLGDHSSRWFVLALAVVADKRSLERVIKKAWKKFKKDRAGMSELHAYHVNDRIRLYILSSIALIEDIKIYFTAIDKRKIRGLGKRKEYFYAGAVCALLIRAIDTDAVRRDTAIDICLDRRDTKARLRRELEEEVRKAMRQHGYGNLRVNLHISHESHALQAVDFIAWSIFRKCEQGDESFFDLIKTRVV